ncbi:MAG: hypothetical protein ACLP0J_10130 [Solirubrobacteraceae bacterium]
MRRAGAAADEPATGERLKERFYIAMELYRNKQYEKAAASFAAIEAECSPGFEGIFVMAKARRGASLMALKRWREALRVYDEIVADSERLAAFDSERSDLIASIYWARPVCLEQLGRRTEACNRVADLIEAVGSGTTPTQRDYVAGAYLLQARAAEARGRFNEAERAINSAIAQCSRTDEPELRSTLHEAEQMKQSLHARVRPAP